MEVRFTNSDYDRLEIDPTFTGGWPPAVVKAYRNRVNFVRQAGDERDFFAWRSLRFEKLKGERSHQYSLRINDQWRLILEFDGKGPSKTVLIVGIEDYH